MYISSIAVTLFCPVVNVNAAEGVRSYTGLQISFGATSDTYNSTDFTMSVMLQLPIYLMTASMLLMFADIKLLDFFSIGAGVAAGALLFLMPFFCLPTPEAGFAVTDITLSYVGIIVGCLPILAVMLRFICIAIVKDD